MRKDHKVVNWREQGVIVIHHANFPDINLHIVTCYVLVEEEGPPDEFFQDHDAVVEAKIVRSPDGEVGQALDHEEGDVPMSEILEQIATLRVGGEIEDTKFVNAGLVVDNDNDPLPENILSQ